MRHVYLDYAATTPTYLEVIEEPFFDKIYGNSSSIYRLAQKAKGAIEETRERVANLINAKREMTNEEKRVKVLKDRLYKDLKNQKFLKDQ